ncbi:hypothetical protein TSOC_000981 [Tetrabaena socialis]|uniref:Uncharacterized protein n=1 Tax=Tetrabaena socialis TaxID=47790 RepID=A0A2J8AHZ1_9CHLO|nr:hypothetical protein TSOC_000981 [Tetrabaena socialis]|eukprot:PNH12127.1 hypothetical protein TSOC_000981 [Tetrabaena socialis]
MVSKLVLPRVVVFNSKESFVIFDGQDVLTEHDGEDNWSGVRFGGTWICSSLFTMLFVLGSYRANPNRDPAGFWKIRTGNHGALSWQADISRIGGRALHRQVRDVDAGAVTDPQDVAAAGRAAAGWQAGGGATHLSASRSTSHGSGTPPVLPRISSMTPFGISTGTATCSHHLHALHLDEKAPGRQGGEL